MDRLILVSNRLPVSIDHDEERGFTFTPSVGGLATGLSSFHADHESRWVGWADVDADGLDESDIEHIRDTLEREHGCAPVFLSAEDATGFYEGFCNSTVWPLFHHFTQYAEFDRTTWESYVKVNRIFCDAVATVARPGDTIWVQDYQLMLLPAMLRERLPDVRIGWFLHIPFPSFEIFRMLPWRREVLEGLLGADLIGFHTYDYARHFFGSCRRLLGLEEQMGRMLVDGRLVLVDAFPMGIDYERYRDAARTPEARAEAERIGMRTGDGSVVLSIDRLDYSKGIPGRLRAFGAFLERYPEWLGRVTMVAVAVPSRENVETYRQLKTEVDELVGGINGRFGTIEWTPIRYLYRSLPFHALAGLYGAADVALVTPLRDGMNLIAKEYLAAHDGGTGVLVLSEMAGAARELGEALLVNPFDIDQVVEALHRALVMDEDEARARNALMQRRIKRYTVTKWAEEFLEGLKRITDEQAGLDARILDTAQRDRLTQEYRHAGRRLVLLDYDGTLMPFAPRPEDVAPSSDVRRIVRALSEDPANEVVIVSGRDRETLEAWLGDLDVDIVAEHGVWLRGRSGEWVTIEPMSDAWKPRVAALLEMFVDRTPGSFIEEKDFSLVWHYRQVNGEMAETRVLELKAALASVVTDWGLAVMDGNKVLEIKAANVDKGRAAHRWMCREDLDFILAFGDDRTDEDVFEAAPEGAWTIKVGPGPTQARNSVRGVGDVRSLLTRLAGLDS
jgi:trehalose 6-phosphate synthase/phosphatase